MIAIACDVPEMDDWRNVGNVIINLPNPAVSDIIVDVISIIRKEKKNSFQYIRDLHDTLSLYVKNITYVVDYVSCRISDHKNNKISYQTIKLISNKLSSKIWGMKIVSFEEDDLDTIEDITADAFLSSNIDHRIPNVQYIIKNVMAYDNMVSLRCIYRK